LPSGVAYDVRLLDLGVDGACLMSARPIAQGTTIELRFELPAAGAMTPIAARAKVVYSSYSGPAQFRIGVMFSALDPASAAAITTFIA